jgi:hypothetical protein
MYYYDVVGYSSSYITTCLVCLKASIFLVSQCLQFVVVAVMVDWDGLQGCCDVY